MKIGVRLVGLREGRLEARIAELRARLAAGRPVTAQPDTTDWQEVNDGERELGPAAGDLRNTDE